MFKLALPVLISVFVLVSILMLFTFQVSAEQSEVVNLSNTSGESQRVQIFVQGENVYTVWTDDTPGNHDVFFAQSNNRGASFDDPINLSNNNGSSAFPRLLVSEPNIYVVWYDYTLGNSDILFAKSNDTGKTFHVITVKTPEPSYNPWIGISSNNVYMVWNDGGETSTVEFPNGEKIIVDINTGNEEIIIGVSDNGGKTFEFINLSNSPGKTSWNARIRVSEANVFVVWNEQNIGVGSSDIFFSTSTDDGNTFSAPINVSNNTRRSINAGIIESGNTVHLTWNQVTLDSADIFYAKSNDIGKTFSVPINLSNSTEFSQTVRDSQIAVSGNNVFIVWWEESRQDSDVFFIKSVDGGLNFNKPINLSQTSAKSMFPQIISNEENVYVLWHDYSHGNGDIFLRESTDSGATFGSIRNLSNDEGESNIFILGPQIFLSENQVYTVWQNKDENSDLFLTSFTQSEKHDEGQMLLSTLNEAVNIEVIIDRKKLEIDQITNFTLRFFEPEDGNLLKDVNYSFEILDHTGEIVVYLQNQYAQTGVDVQSVTFLQEGPFTLLIDILGTGTDKPFETKNSGIASATITVVPEFPISVIMSMAAVIGFVIIFSAYQKHKLRLL
ncbi:MAG: sialidase family protein [Thaumarchaeota archaeon]|nr:sialidase family protein [Nitrososphaerota archaeon]